MTTIVMVANKYIDKDPYIQAINKSGGTVEIITIDQALHGPLLGIDGILLPGGPDLYNPENPNEAFDGLEPDRDLDFAELELLDFALRVLKVPVLGICRGMQLINQYFGGSLYSHIDEHYVERTAPTHMVWGMGLPIPVFGVEHFGPVNSHHHQSIARLGEGVRECAVAFRDMMHITIIEMIHVPEYPFIVGVQWHPEEMYDMCKPLFDQFIGACS